MSKRKSTATGEEPTAPSAEEIVNLTAQPAKPNPAAEEAALLPIACVGSR
jgi:hypothetical protein